LVLKARTEAALVTTAGAAIRESAANGFWEIRSGVIHPPVFSKPRFAWPAPRKPRNTAHTVSQRAWAETARPRKNAVLLIRRGDEPSPAPFWNPLYQYPWKSSRATTIFRSAAVCG